MKKKIIAKLLLGLLITTSTAFVGCAIGSDSNSENNSGKVDASANIELTDSEISLVVGQEYRLHTDDGRNYNTYASTDESVCSVLPNGVVTAKKAGTAIIQVTVGSKVLTCTVTVTGEKGEEGGENIGNTEAAPMTFLGKEVTSENLLARKPDYVDESSGSLIFTSNYADEIKRDDGAEFAVFRTIGTWASVHYDLLIPEETPAYDYYEWDLYTASPMIVDWVGNKKNVQLQAGWNTVVLTWDQLTTSPNSTGRNILHTGINRFSAGQTTFAIGSLVGRYWDDMVGSSVAILDTVATTENIVVTNGTVSYETENAFVDVAKDELKGLSFTTASEGATLSYASFIDENFSCDYVLWRLYNPTSNNYTVTIGKKTVTLYKSSWSDIKISYGDLVADGAEEQVLTISAADVKIGVGSMTAYDLPRGDETTANFLEYKMASDNIFAGAHNGYPESRGGIFSFSSKQDIPDDGENPFIAYKVAGSYVSIYYNYLIPSEDPGYDYYEWRIYSKSVVIGFQIGSKVFNLDAGWNSVYLTWEELTGGNQEIWSGVGAYTAVTWSFGIGSLTGQTGEKPADPVVTLRSGAYFAGSEITSDNLFAGKHNGTHDTAGGVFDFLNTQGLPADGTNKFVAYKVAGSYVSIYYDELISSEDPGYDYYEWRIYSKSVVIGFQIGSKVFNLNAGWNSVYLTWAELTGGNQEIWSGLGAYTGGTWSFGIGSLVGQTGEKPADSEVTICSGVYFADTEITSINLFAGTHGGTHNTAGGVFDFLNAQGIPADDNNEFVAYKVAGSYVSIYYDELISSEDPGYDYYEWRLYSAVAASNYQIGGKTGIALEAGWNTVELTWSELTGGNQEIWSGTGVYTGATWSFGIGALTGVTEETVEEDLPTVDKVITVILDMEGTQKFWGAGTVSGNTVAQRVRLGAAVGSFEQNSNLVYTGTIYDEEGNELEFYAVGEATTRYILIGFVNDVSTFYLKKTDVFTATDSTDGTVTTLRFADNYIITKTDSGYSIETWGGIFYPKTDKVITVILDMEGTQKFWGAGTVAGNSVTQRVRLGAPAGSFDQNSNLVYTGKIYNEYGEKYTFYAVGEATTRYILIGFVDNVSTFYLKATDVFTGTDSTNSSTVTFRFADNYIITKTDSGYSIETWNGVFKEKVVTVVSEIDAQKFWGAGTVAGNTVAQRVRLGATAGTFAQSTNLVYTGTIYDEEGNELEFYAVGEATTRYIMIGFVNDVSTFYLKKTDVFTATDSTDGTVTTFRFADNYIITKTDSGYSIETWGGIFYPKTDKVVTVVSEIDAQKFWGAGTVAGNSVAQRVRLGAAVGSFEQNANLVYTGTIYDAEGNELEFYAVGEATTRYILIGFVNDVSTFYLKATDVFTVTDTTDNTTTTLRFADNYIITKTDSGYSIETWSGSF